MSKARIELQQLTLDGSYEVVARLDKHPSWGGRRKGAGRPKTAACSHSISFRVSSYTLDCLKAAAAARETTVAAVAKQLVLAGLEIVPGEIDPGELVTTF